MVPLDVVCLPVMRETAVAASVSARYANQAPATFQARLFVRQLPPRLARRLVVPFQEGVGYLFILLFVKGGRRR